MGSERAVCFAETYVRAGTKERPRYSNHGRAVDSFNRRAGCYISATPGNPWCASFISHILRLGHNSRDINTCSTRQMVSQYKNTGHKVRKFAGRKIYSGDVLYRSRPCPNGSCGHVGIVSFVGSNGFSVIEGNTKCRKSANDCVRKRWYYKNGTPKDADNQGKGAWEKVLRW